MLNKIRDLKFDIICALVATVLTVAVTWHHHIVATEKAKVTSHGK